MALDLLDEVSRFKIRHRTDETIKLRIGIHSGPCAAGVLNIPWKFSLRVNGFACHILSRL